MGPNDSISSIHNIIYLCNVNFGGLGEMYLVPPLKPSWVRKTENIVTECGHKTSFH